MLRPAIYLSLPVVLGAVLSNRMAARLSDVDPVHWATTPVLAIVVWMIYTTDRLLDIRHAPGPITARHRFHAEHADLLWGGIGGLGAVGIILVFFLPMSAIRFGAILGVSCLTYVLAVYQFRDRHPALVVKEPLVQSIREAGDEGKPSLVSDDGPSADAFRGAAEALARRVAIRNATLDETKRVEFTRV